MADLDISIDDKSIEEIGRLASEHYGDDSEASRQRVVEAAIEMRLLWSRMVAESHLETEEATSRWEFSESPSAEEDSDTIRRWLFRR